MQIISALFYIFLVIDSDTTELRIQQRSLICVSLQKAAVMQEFQSKWSKHCLKLSVFPKWLAFFATKHKRWIYFPPTSPWELVSI